MIQSKSGEDRARLKEENHQWRTNEASGRLPRYRQLVMALEQFRPNSDWTAKITTLRQAIDYIVQHQSRLSLCRRGPLTPGPAASPPMGVA